MQKVLDPVGTTPTSAEVFAAGDQQMNADNRRTWSTRGSAKQQFENAEEMMTSPH